MKYILTFLLLTTFIFAQDVKQAPDFELEDFEGEVYELADFTGEGPVIINFWATWCKPCIAEFKVYDKIYNEYKDKGLQLVAISIDSERSLPKVKPFVKSNNYNFKVLLDPGMEAARKYYVTNVPVTFLLNKNGEIVYQHSGYKKGDEAKLLKAIKKELTPKG